MRAPRGNETNEEEDEREIVETAEEHDEVTNCVEKRVRKIREVLKAKAEMYASSSNRLHNFDFAARILNCTPEQALQGMLMKHIVSVLDLIEWTETMPLRITEALIEEKIGDNINYLILLESLFLRRIREEEVEKKEDEQTNKR
jgi:hypothetical protein